MPLFRKRPVVIEARLFEGTSASADALIAWMGGVGKFVPRAGEFGGLYVGTLEDGDEGEAKHVASPGDWIICGVHGEFYACKPDIFAKTYEPVEDGEMHRV